MKPTKIETELIGGPMDGFQGWREAFVVPGQCPMIKFEYPKLRRKAVYQARSAEPVENGPTVFDFVQYIGFNESCLD